VRLFGRAVSASPRVLLILAAVLLVSSGLCGVQWAVAIDSRNQMATPVLIALGVAELAAMALSAGGIVVVLVVWGALALYRLGKKQTDEEK